MNTITPDSVVLETNLPGLTLLSRGKVRDIYDLDDHLLIVTTDRISAFDCILPTGIPDKGAVLTSMSRYWLGQTRGILGNQLDNVEQVPIPPSLEKDWPVLSHRSMIVKKAKPFPIECVARGYLSGSAWKEYRQNVEANNLRDGRVPCTGVLLPTGLVESDKLPAPIFTPATKAATGHDINISFYEAAELVGGVHAERLRDFTLAIYQKAASYAADRGIIIADTKLEFGLLDDQIILIDEVLTPDSSR
ncbi:MAG: phosphoribosylaminoimidazolesuccinocarboxamide synthase, partial [Armatimonadota bacterium]|nr:phosphoribosylaminoimidazolesuccinocarboxamide synthase [Armatimonadota bacterium]